MEQQALLYRYNSKNEQEELLTDISKDLCIGSSANADVRLEDWKCNGIHALIKTNESGTYSITDLGSYYGTSVNKQSIEFAELKDGDKLIIGEQKLIFRLKEINNDIQNDFITPDFGGKKRKDPFQKKYGLKSEQETLEVSMYWGDQLLEVKSFSEGSTITIGNLKSCTFGIHLNALEYQNKEFPIADYQNGNLKLKIPKDANGLVWTDSKTVSLDTLRFHDEDYVGQEQIDMVLTRGERAHLEFGELALTFNFVHPAENIKTPLLPKLDKVIVKLFSAIFLLYSLIFVAFQLYEPELKEKTLKDVPKHLKKMVYKAGLKNAKQINKSAIGEMAKNIGGRAKSEEGKSQARKDIVKKKTKKKSKAKKKVTKKKKVKKARTKRKVKKKLVAKQSSKKKKSIAQREVSLDLDKAFSNSSSSAKTTTQTTILSKVKRAGNTASALNESGFARGKSGLGAGGGGQSVGIGSLKGSSSGGGLGAGNYGLKSSKGIQIRIPDQEEISIQDGLDPSIIAAYIKRYLPQIQYCYEQELVKKPKLRGKVTVGFTIMGNGGVKRQKVLESTLRDNPTHKCMLSKIAKWKFPKPRGGGTVGVKYPFILMSNSGN